MCSPRLLSQVYESIGREDRKVSRRSMFSALGVTALGATALAGGSLGSVGSLGSLTESAFYLNELRMGEHTGTHIDAPAHASADGITVEMIPVADLDAGRSRTYGAHRNALGSGK